MIDKFEGEFPKLSKVNSLAIRSHIIYFKKFQGSFVAWDYKTKIKIVATDNKERLKVWLIENEDEIVRRIDAYN